MDGYNKLSLNLEKTKVMIFGNWKEKTNMNIQIDNKIIEKVSEIKFLGIIIDKNLNWKAHINYIQKKVSKNIAICNKAKWVLNYNALYILYFSLVFPYLTYVLEVWGNNYKTTLQPLVKLQKRAVRIIHKADYLEHTNTLFLQSKIIKFLDLVNFYTAQLVFKASRNILPPTIQGQFTERNSEGYNLRGSGKLIPPAIRTTRRSMCVSVCGVRLWNSLGSSLKQSSHIHQFKAKFKEMLLLQYSVE